MSGVQILTGAVRGDKEMKEQDVRIGMKVVPRDKTAGYDGLENSYNYKIMKEINQPYLFVDGKTEEGFLLHSRNRMACAEAFNACDFEPYIDIPDTADALNRALREEISKAFEGFRVSGTPYSSFTIFEAGYHAGMKRGDK